MNSPVLARKWRPSNFGTMVGQTHAVQALTFALSNDRLHHAYLFTGTHGVGKTSIARILAKALSCQRGISATPCGECQHCHDIDAGQFVDVIEIDAASRSKVEDTREILDNVLYPPTQGPFKIYLIDEVHMLSGHSFNALLKTLEEPPSHVKFLLATTEPKKLPITVLSRCLQFHLKNITSQEMTNHLSRILNEEKITYEATALPWIAQAANGSVRDALTLLDQAIAQGQNQVLEKNIRDMLGYVEAYYIIQLAEALIEKNAAKILAISADLQHQGRNCAEILRELQRLFHQLTVLQCVPDYQFDNASYALLSNKISPEDLQLFYQIALKGLQDLPFAPTSAIGLEMALLRMLAFQPNVTTELPPLSEGKNSPPLLSKGGNKLEDTSARGNKHEDPSEKLNKHEDLAKNVHKAEEHSTKLDNKLEIPFEKTSDTGWDTLLPKLNLSGLVNSAAQHCSIKSLTDTHLILSIPAQRATFLTSSIKNQIEEAVKQYFLKHKQQGITIVFESTEEIVNSPATKKQEQEKKVLTELEDSFQKDKNLDKILEVFHGTIVPDSMNPL